MEKQRTTDLFRFITMRSPESVSTPRKNLGFIEHVNVADSIFLRHLGSPTFEADLATEVASFLPKTKVAEIEALSPEIRAFAQWLSENKNSLDKDAAVAKLPVDTLTTGEIKTLWDNVYFSILVRANHPIRQECLQMLIALNFIAKEASYYAADPTDEVQKAQETADLQRLANGKVLINKALAAAKSTSQVAATPSRKRTAKQETQFRAKVAGLQVDTLKGIRKELGCYEKQYQQDYTAALNTASATYETAVKDAMDEYFAKRPETRHNSETEYTLPEGLVADFKFTFDLPFSEAYSAGRLSDTSMDYVKANCLRRGTVKEVIDFLESDISKTQKVAARGSRKQFKTMLINGVLTRPNSSEPKEFMLSFKKNSAKEGEPITYTMLLLLDTGYNGAFPKTSSVTLKYNGVDHVDDDHIKVLSNSDNALFMQVYNAFPLDITENTTFEFEASILLDNGKELYAKKGGIFNAVPMSGYFTSLDLSSEFDELYGINRLGIADYRRVEQELCCYIPGEVSHIENVMAREYKERSTRNLTTTETSTESTTEREMEDLTDTTSSTRHEMSSEVAEVIERDRQSNLGFSAGVNGTYPSGNYSVNASGDFTFGQSSSDSNTMAQTYAEDVTRRALERIVQKTTQKRTSKMVREFEENNKHGYDNREGEKHVTGIYRWVDKVYKNRIFNYGKRLMYEFMVPEPSRFYKDAIIIEAEEEDSPVAGGNGAAGSTTVAVKPTHPSEYGMKDAMSLTRDNYSGIAAHYGVSIDAPMNEFSNAAQSYAQNIGNTDSDKSFSDSNLRVPDNYQCTSINASINYSYKAKVKPRAYIKMNAAGQNWERTDISGEGSATGGFTPGVSNIEGSITVSFNTKKITAFNASVSLTCRLKSSIFEQWQQDTYADIIRAYEDQLRAFNDAQAEAAAAAAAAAANSGAEDDGKMGGNPLFNAEIVRTELKRLCIEMMTKPFGIEQGRDFYQSGSCNVPNLILTPTLDVYSSRVKFFEQAFDWDLMSQKFYPYYWAKRCDWKTLFQAQDGNDYNFQAFLQSGMGRVVVPVRQGFEDAVTYFMETGEVWNGVGLTFDTDDQLYLSIVDELTKPAGYVEGIEWETTVPSTLTILQARSALLDEEGLPCCHTIPLTDDPTIKADTNILELKDDSGTLGTGGGTGTGGGRIEG